MKDIDLATGAKTPVRRQRREAADRRQDLLAVTLRCLAELGPKGTTGREVCRRAGVSHGLLRHYFANPQNLLFETYEALCDRYIEQFETILNQPGADPWETLDQLFVRLFSEEWSGPESLGAWQAFWTMTRSDPAFAAKSEEYNAALRELLAAALARLPRSGAMPIEDAAACVSAIMDGLWLDLCLSQDRTSRERALYLCREAVRRVLG
jgi:AcrR family transcriptional regulator